MKSMQLYSKKIKRAETPPATLLDVSDCEAPIRLFAVNHYFNAFGRNAAGS